LTNRRTLIEEHEHEQPISPNLPVTRQRRPKGESSMPRVAKRQQEPKSCGAATLLVALHELTGNPARTTNTEEQAIYNAIKYAGFGPNLLGKDETLPSSVCTYAIGKGLHAEIIESPTTSGALLTRYPGAGGMYALYRANLGTLTLHSRDLAANDLNGDARLFLVMKFQSSDLTHYVLARKVNGQVYIMNPDPGSDEQMAIPAVGAALQTNNHGSLTYDPMQGRTVNDGTLRNYVFTGIAIRAWR
jgi:hypothetical protein